MDVGTNGGSVKKWHFDAWAVLDGLAFASKRSAEQIEADHTIFLSVPELEAIPIGRISTGLLATRYNFQQGLRNNDGEEIGFESLDQVREMVRRGYLAGGIGPGPAGLRPEPIFPGVDSPGSLGGQYYESQLEMLSQDEIQSQDCGQIANIAKREKLFGVLQRPSSIQPLWQTLRAFAEATIIEWGQQFLDTSRAGGVYSAFYQWYLALLWIRLWERPEDEIIDKISAFPGLKSELVKTISTIIQFENYPFFPSRFTPREIESSVLLTVPCPLRPGWNRTIRTLGDKLFLSLSIRYYLKRNDGLAEFVPTILASLFLAVTAPRAPMIQLRNVGSDLLLEERIRLARAAFDWLEKELPQAALPEQAEEVLEGFAWSRLGPYGS
jgi:hypothetical protein